MSEFDKEMADAEAEARLTAGRLSLEYGETALPYIERKAKEALDRGDEEGHRFWTVARAWIRPRAASD